MERKFQIIVGHDWPDSVSQAWRTLSENNPRSSHVHTYSWNRACVEHLGTGPESAILILVYQGKTLEAIFPFSTDVHRTLGIRVRVLRLSQHPHINLHDVVLCGDIDHHNLVADLFRFLKSHRDYECDVMQFGSLLENSSALQLLRNEKELRTTVFASAACDCVPVMSEDELRNFVSKNMRGNLRKARNKLDKCGEVKFRTTREPVLLRQFFAHFLEVEASGWKGAAGAGTAIKLHASLTAFYRQLVESFSVGKRCEINLLEVDGRVVAGQFALIAGDTMYLLKIGYDEEFREVAPGNLLLAHTLHRLREEGEVVEVNLITDAPLADLRRQDCCLRFGISVASWVCGAAR